ncbi:hypothetical protein LR48_Vigan06g035700 [Vigna angularis]|uniref:Uncharacterized protein n=1 Tax=Phaseolus angularis TaxID=3914 RepID=A0A0L9UQT3_PHAAN|nr:hypothetical protein LR48_Vigan06g035700 [Vigna angularis]
MDADFTNCEREQRQLFVMNSIRAPRSGSGVATKSSPGVIRVAVPNDCHQQSQVNGINTIIFPTCCPLSEATEELPYD